MSGKTPVRYPIAAVISSPEIASVRIRFNCVISSASAESVTEVRTSAVARNRPMSYGRVNDEYDPYVQLFCSRRIMNSRASVPPPSTLLATRVA